MKKNIVYLILCMVSVVLAYGKPIEIKGFMAVGLWFAPPALMIFCIKRNTKPFRMVFATILTLYITATSFFLIRENAFYNYSRNFSMNPESRRSAEVRMDCSPAAGIPPVGVLKGAQKNAYEIQAENIVPCTEFSHGRGMDGSVLAFGNAFPL